jgi:8-oxo-dGTP pyrophosphatase MutT (NUDIX family)
MHSFSQDTGEFEVVISGLFADDAIDSTWTPVSRRRTTPAIESAIAAAWRQAESQAQEQGGSLFAGPLCRLDQAAVVAERLHLDFSPTDYREYLGTNRNRAAICPLWPGDEDDVLANATGACAVVRTADGLLLLGRRSPRTMEYPGWWHVPGGHIDPNVHVVAGTVNVVAAVVDEVMEETGLLREEIGRVCCTGLVRPTFSRKPEPTFLVEARCPSAALKGRIGNDEHTEWRFVEATSRVVQHLLTEETDLVPAARGCLLLASPHLARR